MNVKQILKRKGYTVTQVAEEMGINRGSLYNMLSGNPTVESLQKIADIVGCDVAEFFGSVSFVAIVCNGSDTFRANTPEELAEIMTQFGYTCTKEEE
jgi:transcriptional regulator with XRE-family HTH domain